MSNDIDDVLRDLMANPPAKPQSKPTGVFSSPKPKKIQSAESIPQPKESKPEDEEPPDMIYKAVTKVRYLPTCGTCRIKLKTGEKHWYYSVVDRNGERDTYWWCTKCMKDHCNMHPPEEKPSAK